MCILYWQMNTEFHNSLLIQHSPDRGRYAVAKRALTKGELLYTELPYCAVLLKSCWPHFCYHCLAPLALPVDKLTKQQQQQQVACNLNDGQCGVRFCNVECRNFANSYHRFECRDLHQIESTGIGHLALRILLTACSTLTTPAGAEHWLLGACSGSGEKCHLPADYAVIDALCDNAELHAPEDVADYGRVAQLLAAVACRRGLLTGASPISVDREQLEQIVSARLLRHIMQLICNAHAILSHYEFNPDEGRLTLQLGEQRIASGVYPLTSCLNHSCQPSVASTFSTLSGAAGLVSVRALADLSPGDQVFNCYGPHYLRHDWLERRQSLSDQYFFRCDCLHCVAKDAGNQRHRALRCPGPACRNSDQPALLTWSGDDLDRDPSLACLTCGSVFSDPTLLSNLAAKLDDANSRLTQAGLLADQQPEDALALLRGCQAKLTACVYSANSRLGRCHDLQARCLSRLGKPRQAAAHAIRSANIVKVQFGSDSVEYAKELFKVCELLALAGETERLKQTSEICLRLLRMYYGGPDSCPLINELEAMYSSS